MTIFIKTYFLRVYTIVLFLIRLLHYLNTNIALYPLRIYFLHLLLAKINSIGVLFYVKFNLLKPLFVFFFDINMTSYF